MKSKVVEITGCAGSFKNTLVAEHDTMQKRFQVLAVNDDRSECECCGKQGLKRVVWIEDTETNIIRHFGVVCALSPAKGFDVKAEVQKATRSFEAEIENMRRIAFREYRKRGGKLVSNGIPLADGGALVYENQALFDQIFHTLKQPQAGEGTNPANPVRPNVKHL